MDMQSICQRVFQNAFAQAFDSFLIVAYITIKVKDFPFDINEFREMFRSFVRNTPLSNVDLEIIETDEVVEGVLVLDTLETFSDDDNPPQIVPFHDVLRIVQLS